MSDFVPVEHGSPLNYSRSLKSSPSLVNHVQGDSCGSTPRLSNFIPAKPFSPMARSSCSTPSLSCFVPNGMQNGGGGGLKPFPERSNGFKQFHEKSPSATTLTKFVVSTKEEDDDLGHMIPDDPK